MWVFLHHPSSPFFYGAMNSAIANRPLKWQSLMMPPSFSCSSCFWFSQLGARHWWGRGGVAGKETAVADDDDEDDDGDDGDDDDYGDVGDIGDDDGDDADDTSGGGKQPGSGGSGSPSAPSVRA